MSTITIVRIQSMVIWYDSNWQFVHFGIFLWVHICKGFDQKVIDMLLKYTEKCVWRVTFVRGPKKWDAMFWNWRKSGIIVVLGLILLFFAVSSWKLWWAIRTHSNTGGEPRLSRKVSRSYLLLDTRRVTHIHRNYICSDRGFLGLHDL